ncbi:hypothetical protein [Amycolatopsis jejuensis]|uniref:hypothetical protein n=1 Tax=Amycolatopsis jejuensis TaxID=330084 RepID=UPI000526455D|nr:hypothetical protein [Amycolatopsis jejuensis]
MTTATTTDPAADAPKWTSEAMNTPENTTEMAHRIRTALRSGFEMYSSVHRTLFAPVIQVALAHWEQTPDQHQYLELDHDGVAGSGNYGAFLRRTIPDIDVAGTATARTEETLVADYTITGTLPDGPLHLHSEATYTVENGLVVRYLVRHDPAEWQRFLRATGNPYEGGGLPDAELD